MIPALSQVSARQFIMYRHDDTWETRELEKDEVNEL